MTDIVERLHDIPADLCWTEDKGAHRNIPAGAIAHEAADEIERLNAARHADSQRMVRMSDEYEAAQDEIERLMAEHDDYVIRANANVCELNREIERLRARVADLEDQSQIGGPITFVPQDRPRDDGTVIAMGGEPGASAGKSE